MGWGATLPNGLARDEVVDDVPSTATARVRELSRGGRRKNDVIDASAAASVAALQGDANRVEPEDLTTVLALLDEQRSRYWRAPSHPCAHRNPCLGGQRRSLTGGMLSKLSRAGSTAKRLRFTGSQPDRRPSTATS